MKLTVPPRKNPEDPFTNRECRLILQHYLEDGATSMVYIARKLKTTRKAIMQACRRATEFREPAPIARTKDSRQIDLSLIKGIKTRLNRCLSRSEQQLIIDCLRVNAGIRGAQIAIAKSIGMSPAGITRYSCKADAMQDGRR